MGVMNCEVKEQHQPGIQFNFVRGFPSNQVFVLSGPFPSQNGQWIAHPVPFGATVIATPITSEPLHKMPVYLPQKMTVWNNAHPKGQSVPLRQPEPTVYFCGER